MSNSNASGASGAASKSLEKARSILARVTLGNANAPWRIVIYGPRGVGKSTWASNCPGAVVIPIEEGVNQLRVNQLPQAKSWQELHDVLDALLVGEHTHKAVVIDGVDSGDALIVSYLNEVLSTGKRKVVLRNKKEAKSWADLNEDYGGGYAAITDEWRLVMKKLDLLRLERGMIVILVGHAKANKIENLEGKDYDKWEMKCIGHGTTELLCDWADYVLFARRETDLVSLTIGTGRRAETKTVATSGNLIVHCRPAAAFDAKTRGDIPFPEKLPLEWSMFERTARLIVEHGRELPGKLRAEFEILSAKILDPERKEKAKQTFEECAAENQWVYMQGCVKRCEEILAEQAR